MVQAWRTEVERPWVGMTDEEMTDVERARADLAIAVEVIREHLSLRARLAAVQRHLTGVAVAAATLVLLAAAVFILAGLVTEDSASHRRGRVFRGNRSRRSGPGLRAT